MKRAILTFVIVFVVGILSMVFSTEILNDYPAEGAIAAIATAAALIVYFNEKKK